MGDKNEHRGSGGGSPGWGLAAGGEGLSARGWSAADEYDALADLFLGPTGPAERTPARDPEPDLLEDAPAPLKFPGAPRRVERSPVRLEQPAERAEFPEAREGSEDESAVIDPAAPRFEPAGRVEMVTPAHLPVMASAWVHQYARAAAVRTGAPVGLVRVRGVSVSIDVVGFEDELDGLGMEASAAEAVRAAGAVCGSWIVQPGEGVKPGPGVSCVTVLTGADDAAIVGCYRKLKELFPSGASGSARARVVVVGATPDRAAAAMRKISRAACEFLGRTVEFGEPMPRVGQGPGDPALVLRAVHAGQAAGDAGDYFGLVASVTGGGAAAAAPGPRRPARAPVAVEPKIAAPAAAPREASGALAGLVSGLRPVGLGCPVAGGVELASDAEGRLHLVAGADMPGWSRPASEAVEALVAASAWAVLNAGLLRSASGAIRVLGEDTPPALHLVTGEPVKARRLLDAPLRVHVVVNAASPGVVAKALN